MHQLGQTRPVDNKVSTECVSHEYAMSILTPKHGSSADVLDLLDDCCVIHLLGEAGEHLCRREAHIGDAVLRSGDEEGQNTLEERFGGPFDRQALQHTRTTIHIIFKPLPFPSPCASFL